MREQAAGVVDTAQMINMSMRTGMMGMKRRERSRSFRDVIQMGREQAEATLHATPTLGQRVMEVLGRLKFAACFPLAVAALPYVRMRGYKGTYLYCLARKCG